MINYNILLLFYPLPWVLGEYLPPKLSEQLVFRSFLNVWREGILRLVQNHHVCSISFLVMSKVKPEKQRIKPQIWGQYPMCSWGADELLLQCSVRSAGYRSMRRNLCGEANGVYTFACVSTVHKLGKRPTTHATERMLVWVMGQNFRLDDSARNCPRLLCMISFHIDVRPGTTGMHVAMPPTNASARLHMLLDASWQMNSCIDFTMIKGRTMAVNSLVLNFEQRLPIMTAASAAHAGKNPKMQALVSLCNSKWVQTMSISVKSKSFVKLIGLNFPFVIKLLRNILHHNRESSEQYTVVFPLRKLIFCLPTVRTTFKLWGSRED